VGRATEFGLEHDAAISRMADIIAERDAAVARAEKLRADAETAAARTAELTAERDAALTRIAKLSSERDAAVACAADFLKAQKKAAVPADAPEHAIAGFESDAYSTLFPSRRRRPRAAAALALGFVGIVIALAVWISPRSPQRPPPGQAAVTPPLPLPDFRPPTIAERPFTLASPTGEITMTLIPSRPLLGAGAGAARTASAWPASE
jgi:hypothetical protein